MKRLTASRARKAERTAEAVSDRPALKYEGELYCGKCFTRLMVAEDLFCLGVQTKRYSCPECLRGYSDKVFCEECGYEDAKIVDGRIHCGKCDSLEGRFRK